MEKEENSTDFDSVYVRYHGLLFDIAKTHLGDEDLSKDVEQDVWVEYIDVVSKKKIFKSENHIKNWLIKVANNLAVNMVRNYSKSIIENISLEQINAKKIIEKIIFPDKRIEVILDELENMDNKYSTVFAMHYFENVKIFDISKELVISESAVKKRLQRARDYIKLGLKAKLKALEC